MTVEYNTCDLCNVEEETYRLIWGQDQHDNIRLYLYGKIVFSTVKSYIFHAILCVFLLKIRFWRTKSI